MQMQTGYSSELQTLKKIDNGDNNVFIEEWDTTYVWLYIFINNHETKN